MISMYTHIFKLGDHVSSTGKEGSDGSQTFSIRNWEANRICVSYGIAQYYPATGDWRGMLDDDAIEAEDLSAQMIGVVFSNADPLPDTAIEILHYEVPLWIKKFRLVKNLYGESPALNEVAAMDEQIEA